MSKYLFTIAIAFCLTIAPFNSTVADEKTKTNPNTTKQDRNLPTNYTCQKASELPFNHSYKQMEFKQSWCGSVPKQLRSLAPSKLYVSNRAEWSKLWQAYRGREALPNVNFSRELVLIYVHFDDNSVEMAPALSTIKSDLAVAIYFTERGSDRNGPCTYMFATFDRRGIKTINGKPIVIQSSKGF